MIFLSYYLSLAVTTTILLLILNSSYLFPNTKTPRYTYKELIVLIILCPLTLTMIVYFILKYLYDYLTNTDI